QGMRTLCNRSDEAVASAMRGFNEAWRLWIILECFAELANNDFKDSLAHVGSRPNSVEKLLLGYELFPTSKQVVEHRESFGPQLYCLRAFGEGFVDQVQTKGIELYMFIVRHGSHQV